MATYEEWLAAMPGSPPKTFTAHDSSTLTPPPPPGPYGGWVTYHSTPVSAAHARNNCNPHLKVGMDTFQIYDPVQYIGPPTTYGRVPYPIALSNLYERLLAAQSASRAFIEVFESDTVAVRLYTPRTILRTLWHFRLMTQWEANATSKNDYGSKYQARKMWKDSFHQSRPISWMSDEFDADFEIERRGSATQAMVNNGQVGAGALWPAIIELDLALALAACALEVMVKDEGAGSRSGCGEASVSDRVKGNGKVFSAQNDEKDGKGKGKKKEKTGKSRKSEDDSDEEGEEHDELLKEVLRKCMSQWLAFRLHRGSVLCGPYGMSRVQEGIKEHLKMLESAEYLWTDTYKDGGWREDLEKMRKAFEDDGTYKFEKEKPKEVHYG